MVEVGRGLSVRGNPPEAPGHRGLMTLQSRRWTKPQNPPGESGKEPKNVLEADKSLLRYFITIQKNMNGLLGC